MPRAPAAALPLFWRDHDPVSSSHPATASPLASCQSQEAHNCDKFRAERFYTEGVDLMLRPRESHLKRLFDTFVGTRKASSTLATEMVLVRWLDMLDKLSLLDDDFSRREAILCFTWSKQLVPDELLHRDRFISLGFYGAWRVDGGARCGTAWVLLPPCAHPC